MNVSYKGMKQELPPKLQSKLTAKFAKLSKLLEKRGEREAHVMVTPQRHLQKAEITIQFYDHQLVAHSTDPDLFTALSTALEKLETQAVKNRAKWQERRKEKAAPPREPKEVAAAPAPKKEKASAAKGNQKIYRVENHKKNKPMTLDEAMLEMDKSKDYMVYQDSEKGKLSMLVRRRDGHFDLIEG